MKLFQNIKKVIALVCISVYCACAFAQVQYTDQVLAEAYMANDMKVWDAYLHSKVFSQLSLAEKKRYLNYEYGYVATAIETKAPDAQKHLDDFSAHVKALEKHMPKSTFLTYSTSLLAYQGMINKLLYIPKGLEAFKLVKEAYKADPSDPMMLCLKGNVDFYAPKSFGGNKERALGYFYTAIRTYEQQNEAENNWNYLSARLCAVQCEDKIGNVNKALEMAKQLLKEFPKFKFLRDEYLPDLQKRAAKKK